MAGEKIEKARQQASDSNRTKSLRVYKIPEINFKVNAYFELINWPKNDAGVCQNLDYGDASIAHMISINKFDEWADSSASPM